MFDDRYGGRQSHHKHQSRGKFDNWNLNRIDKIFQTVNSCWIGCVREIAPIIKQQGIQNVSLFLVFDDRYGGRQSHHKHQSMGKFDIRNLNRTDKLS